MSLLAENLSVFDPVSPPAESIRNLFYLVLAITGVIFVLVEGMLIYCIVRFRRQAGDSSEPPQIYGSQPIEVAWTLAPLLVVFVLFLVVIRTVLEVRQDTPPEGALVVTVVGHQWWWEYRYRDPERAEQRVVVANDMHVPVGVPVFLELESADVIHSFWVPRLAGKVDLIPGKTNSLWFRANQAGVYGGHCAEYCGAQHANMVLRVVAEPADDFERWLANQKKDAVDEEPEGKSRFMALACVNCHRVRGTSAVGTFGPDLTHLMSRPTLAARVLANDREHLLAWLRNPQDKYMKPGCNMPSLQLDDRELEEVVNFLLTLK